VTSLIAARKEGRTPEELTAHYNRLQAAAFAGLGIRFDVYGGTHQPDFVELHNRLSGEFFKTIHDKGYFVKRTTMQMYDPEAKQFLPDRFIKGTCYHKKDDGTPCGYAEAYGDQCESCGKMIDPMELIDPVSTITGARPSRAKRRTGTSSSTVRRTRSANGSNPSARPRPIRRPGVRWC
jgi:methionyl-tRNA synthetase